MSKSISRRDFLKGSACTLGALNLDAKFVVNDGARYVKSFCEMCSSRCQIEARVVDGKCDFIMGNPKFSSNKTSVCARGGAGVNQLYDKQRLLKPLLRVGQRGEGKWKEISWDEAYEFCAKKLDEIKDKYGAKSVVFTSKSGESHNQLTNFACSYGSPNIFSHWSCCPITEKIAVPHTFGVTPKIDYENAKYIVNFGHNLFEGIDISKTKKLAKSVYKSDTKFLVLEPRFSVVAAKADEWLAVRPGTDLAFVMALIHIWLRDGKYDKDFVNKFTVGLEELKEAVKDSTPKWQENLTGIKAEVVERIADEIYKAAPRVVIDWGHKTTTTRAEYQRTRAISIANALMGNFEKVGGIFFGKKSSDFNKICDEELFLTLANPDKNFKIPKISRIDGCGEDGHKHYFIPRKHGVLMDIAPAILEEKPYPIKGWVSTRFNHLINVAGEEKSIEAIKKLDFVMAVDIYMSDFAWFADIVLPESTYLERDEAILDKSSTSPAFCMRNKVIEPLGDTKSGYEIFRQLARKMQIDKDYTWNNINEYRMQQAKGNHELVASLIKDGYVSWKVPKLYYMDKKSVSKFVEKYPKSAKFVDENGLMSSLMKFKTPSGKIELFLQSVEDKLPGEGCLHTRDMDVYDGFELCLMSGKTPIHTNGHTQNIKVLNDMMDQSPMWINTKTAQKYNLKTGDTVLVKSKFASGYAKVLVTEGIREDSLFVYHGFGHVSKGLKRTFGDGLNQSKLLNPADGAVSGTMVTNVGVEIKKV
ncbi:thiosulfate reductase PhsA [Campylobacter sp. FMV-PI01]|uniref:Thiosulfate reductase PhsA n=1 Tax=Campylobacter portucalensis TaxID=2608384 RepID=A0A6L5WFG7_9BACT|nr:thiosulfate reductase PhsA [Campylobacter portucalensis]MSN95770.1 thiosulfate reductase PhsA [Campylobacter portucalensis]